jgi:hypothetical protein
VSKKNYANESHSSRMFPLARKTIKLEFLVGLIYNLICT